MYQKEGAGKQVGTEMKTVISTAVYADDVNLFGGNCFFYSGSSSSFRALASYSVP
jgi:hypothetical protein